MKVEKVLEDGAYEAKLVNVSRERDQEFRRPADVDLRGCWREHRGCWIY